MEPESKDASLPKNRQHLQQPAKQPLKAILLFASILVAIVIMSYPGGLMIKKMEDDAAATAMATTTARYDLALELQNKIAKKNRDLAWAEGYWLSFYRVCLFVHEDKSDPVKYCHDMVRSGYQKKIHLQEPPEHWDFDYIRRMESANEN